MKKYGVIMAGGGGTRFWPLSRLETPKQLLNLTGKDLMINETIKRLMTVTNSDNILVVTNAIQVEKMKKVTKEYIPTSNILSEPTARNTAACIGYAALEILKKHGDGIMVITPSDSFIKNELEYTNVLKKAIKEAVITDKLITIGIKPTFASTGYGYIQFKENNNDHAKTVTEFKEKPNSELAKSYLKSGIYLWNSGIFIWKASTILNKFKEYVPDIYEDLMKIGDKMNTPFEFETINEIYSSIRNISIDYAIMEPAAEKNDVLMIPGDFGWNDVGSWDMMNVIHDSDENNNIKIGDVISFKTNDTTVYSKDKLVATIGVDNLVIVQTEDAILICNKNNAQDVKLIVEELTRTDRNNLL